MLTGLDAERQLPQNLVELLRIGSGRQNRLLGAAHLGRRHHLHGVGDALDVRYAGNPGPELA